MANPWSALVAAFADSAVDEVLVNGDAPLWLVAGAASHAVASPFAGGATLASWLLAFARQQGVRLDPLCGAAGGSVTDEAGLVLRWHALLPPLARDGPLFSLRRHRFAELTLAHFAGDETVKARLVRGVRARHNLLIAGPTGSGKTTLLAALLRDHAARERLVVVESLPELPLLGPHCVRLLERRANLEGVGAVPLTRLVHEALRLRPDRLVIGEIRGAEATAFLEAALTGHDGVTATIHAGTADEARARLVSLAMRYGEGASVNGMCRVAMDVVVLRRGGPPEIVGVTEVVVDV